MVIHISFGFFTGRREPNLISNKNLKIYNIVKVTFCSFSYLCLNYRVWRYELAIFLKQKWPLIEMFSCCFFSFLFFWWGWGQCFNEVPHDFVFRSYSFIKVSLASPELNLGSTLSPVMKGLKWAEVAYLLVFRQHEKSSLEHISFPKATHY